MFFFIKDGGLSDLNIILSAHRLRKIYVTSGFMTSDLRLQLYVILFDHRQHVLSTLLNRIVLPV
jgi:hypothetical protein